MTLLQRLEHFPGTIPAVTLRILMITNANSRGRNARIPPLAFLELEKRSKAMSTQTDNEQVEEARRLIQEGKREEAAAIYDSLNLHTVANIVRRPPSDEAEEAEDE